MQAEETNFEPYQINVYKITQEAIRDFLNYMKC
jgi:hypothetical protein